MLSLARSSNQQLQEDSARNGMEINTEMNKDKHLVSRSMKVTAEDSVLTDLSCLLFLPSHDFIAFTEQISEESDRHCLIGKTRRFILKLLQAAVMISL